MALPSITYRVDAHDRILSVGGPWDEFANDNSGEAATARQVVGRGLFEFITDATTQHLYRQMLARARAGRDLRFTYRCDSPDTRRLMAMEMRLVDSAGVVEFRSAPLQEQPRAPVHFPQADGTSDEPERLQRACGWCNRLEVDGEWMEVEDAMQRLRLLEHAAPPTVTHGMCEDCLARMLAELDATDAAAAGGG